MMIEDKWDKIAEDVVGSPADLGALIIKYGLDVSIEEVEEALFDRNLEPCPICGRWVEFDGMTDELSEDMICRDCYWDAHYVLEVSE